jgi:hypothetical protein
MTLDSAWAELMEMKRATVCRVLALTKFEALRKLEQHWRCTMDPVVI